MANIKKVIIFGGGTSGWLSAAYLVKNLRLPVEVTIIEDTTIGPIGVGEGTQPYTARFLYECGIEPNMWMKDSNASFKLGVELVGWNDTPYFVDNDTYQTHLISNDIYSSDYFINKPHSEFNLWHPSYQLAKENKCPKIPGEFDFNFNLPEGNYGAVHFAAFDIIKTIKKLIEDKITHVDTKIVKIEKDTKGITKLIDKDGIEHVADLYLDCTGFSSLLLEKTLEVPFISYSDYLPCDSAVAIPTQYTNPEEECFPYTRATTMTAGWRWTIPIFSRIGNGYVYSSKFISAADAEHELRSTIQEFDAPANHLKMKCGRHSKVVYKNVCAIGLSAGFVEPLEATGITFTTAVIRDVVNSLNARGNFLSSLDGVNHSFYTMVTEILAFVWAHYHFSSRNDTAFWKSIRNQKIENLPEDAQRILTQHYPVPNRQLFSSPNSMFNKIHWFSVLHAAEAYNGLNIKLSNNQEKYAKYFLDTQTARIELAKKMFPNQYQYLKEWYSKVDN